ncbi:MAG TPA: outer membrane beta-barrel protein [Alphaproteobacteria bacterium]|nr:outer membrane beta-barrel protein [Alphaproteobacteria bacterium]
MLRKYALILLLGCTATILAAQETPKIELFGGYNFTHVKLLGDHDPLTNGNGWTVSAAFNLNKWVGIVADGSGAYSSHPNSPIGIVCFPAITLCSVPADATHRKLHTYTIGPQFSYRTSSRFTPFAHILIGGGYVSITDTFPGGHVTEANGSHVLTLGGGVDYRLTDRVALRTQTDLQQSRFFDEHHDGFRLSTGLVFNFGKK